MEKLPKDVSRYMLKNLSDRDVLNFCITNRKNKEICNEDFFYQLLRERYPDSLKYKEADLTYKKYYLSVIGYVDLLKRKYGFDYKKYNIGNPENQYKLFKDVHKRYENVGEFYLNKGYLLDAAKLGELAIAKYAIENKKISKSDQEWAMRIAASDGHLDIIKYLEGKGIDIFHLGEAPLINAIKNGRLDIIEYLIEKGADIYYHNNLPFRVAEEIKNKYPEILEYLNEVKLYDIQEGRNL